MKSLVRSLVAMLCLAALGLAGCQRAAEAPVAAPAAPATVASAPAPVIAPAPTAPAVAPAVAAVPDSLAVRMEWLTKGARSMDCSTRWMRAAKFSAADSGLHFIDAGVAPEMHEVAQRIAAEHVKKLEGMRMPANDAEQAQLDFAAIGMAKDVPVTDARQLPAVAWMAYFLDRAAQGNCPPGPELMGLIGKQQ